MCLVVCCNGKEATLKLIRTPMIGESKLKLVLMDQMKDKQLVVVVLIEAYGRNSKGGQRKMGLFHSTFVKS